MSFYHDSKDAALLAGALYAEYWETRAELEPYNGWVLVLKPKTREVFNWPLAPLMEVAELDLTGYTRLSKRPATRKKPPTSAEARTAAAPKQAIVELSGDNRLKPSWLK